MNDVRWFVNFSHTNANRTTDTRMFHRLGDARAFASGKYGFILRQDAATDRVAEVVGGFDPSPTEVARCPALAAFLADSVSA